MSVCARGSAPGELRRDLARAAGGRGSRSTGASDANPELRRDPDGTAKPGTLFVVATPIGNLEDITLRALRIFREVALVAAEDTRRTLNLFRHYAIQTPLVSLHEHNEEQRIGLILDRIRGGDDVALVSDAGTPGISDPGALLVRAARKSGIRVDPIPGPSAVTAVLSGSGLAFERFAFAGFPPSRSKDRKEWYEWVSRFRDVPVVCFEAPHRIQATLADLQCNLVNRPIIVAREITKVHEEWRILLNDQITLGEPDAAWVGASTATSVPSRGEFVLIIAPAQPADESRSDVPTDVEIADVFGQMTSAGLAGSRRETIRAVAARFGMSAKTVYDALERAKKTP